MHTPDTREREAARVRTLRAGPLLGMGDHERWRRSRSWLVFAALLAHNLEEALTYPACRSAAGALVAAALGIPVSLPEPAVFQLALVAVTVLAGSALALAGTCLPPRHRTKPLQLIAIVLLANVLLPHVPLAVLLGGYAPGVLTAVLVNLPLGLAVLREARGRRAA